MTPCEPLESADARSIRANVLEVKARASIVESISRIRPTDRAGAELEALARDVAAPDGFVGGLDSLDRASVQVDLLEIGRSLRHGLRFDVGVPALALRCALRRMPPLEPADPFSIYVRRMHRIEALYVAFCGLCRQLNLESHMNVETVLLVGSLPFIRNRQVAPAGCSTAYAYFHDSLATGGGRAFESALEGDLEQPDALEAYYQCAALVLAILRRASDYNELGLWGPAWERVCRVTDRLAGIDEDARGIRWPINLPRPVPPLPR